MDEIWKPIPNYEGIYEVSNLGNFRKLLKGGYFPMKVTRNCYGYYIIGLRKNKKVRQFRVARLVAQTFIPNPTNKPYVDHIDTDKSNNNVTNLRWTTPKENSNNHLTITHLLKSWDSKERKLRQSILNYSSSHPRAKAVAMMDEDGNILKHFPTAADGARAIGCKSQNITKCCTGERLRAGGYRWQYYKVMK